VDTVVRAVTMYLFLLVVFRVAGKRSLSDMSTFDFLLLLVLSETTQQAMVGKDPSMTNAFLLIITWIGMDVGLSLVKLRMPWAEKLLEGLPVVLVEEGKPLRERMRQQRVDDQDVLAAARKLHGLERMEQIKYAVLESSGGISIIPKPPEEMPQRVTV
jgi:uncharacterized membrane protein YcaP (DUF421 family)